jgi:hypothetical protein
MEHQIVMGYDAQGDSSIYVSIVNDDGELIRYLGESELEELHEVIEDWLEKNKLLMDTCGCGGKLDSYQQCERKGAGCTEEGDALEELANPTETGDWFVNGVHTRRADILNVNYAFRETILALQPGEKLEIPNQRIERKQVAK